MAFKNKVQVLIGGKTMTLMGTESEEYLKNVAEYINQKFDEIKDLDSSKALSPAVVSVLTSINVADEYFKEKEKKEALALENESMKLKVFDLARENDKSKEAMQKELSELKHQNGRLEAEIEELKRKLATEEKAEPQSKPVLGSISHTKNNENNSNKYGNNYSNNYGNNYKQR
ncbi:MAG: cell division protein ZapA [Lachnospiraceae bacterium]|nr:cell division protein ZapA [Lachnospiraceae bacterium]